MRRAPGCDAVGPAQGPDAEPLVGKGGGQGLCVGGEQTAVVDGCVGDQAGGPGAAESARGTRAVASH